MFNNGFNNNFNSASNNFKTGNIAGINKAPSSVAGMASKPNNIGGMNKMPTKQDPFAKVYRDNSGPAKQIMNSQGQNMIHNEFRGIK
ncbi:MAG: hypothetical protein E7162_00830 [Firmicutes bacterium]|nr:hypothetical protein [Bacillota bacterium]